MEAIFEFDKYNTLLCFCHAYSFYIFQAEFDHNDLCELWRWKVLVFCSLGLEWADCGRSCLPVVNTKCSLL